MLLLQTAVPFPADGYIAAVYFRRKEKTARNYLDELAKNRLSYIAKAEKVSMERLMRALQEIRSCQPSPAVACRGG